MSYTLEVTFTGMCGFVPVDAAEQRAVHVLFPATTRPDAHGPLPRSKGGNGHAAHAAHAPMDIHVSRLMFDTSALRENTALELWPVVVSLRDRKLELGGGTRELETQLTSHLASLRYLKPGFLGDAANDYITTRVVLRSGQEARAQTGAVYRLKGKNRTMSHRLTWRIEGLTEPLRLTLESLTGKIPQELPPLYPDPSGKLSLFFYHAPPAELPPETVAVEEPARGAVAHHFAALNLLVTEPLAMRSLPRYVRLPPSLKDARELTATTDADEFQRGFVPFNCMGAAIQYSETVQ